MKYSVSVYYKDFSYVDYYFDSDFDLIKFLTDSLYDTKITSFGVVKLEVYKRK